MPEIKCSKCGTVYDVPKVDAGRIVGEYVCPKCKASTPAPRKPFTQDRTEDFPGMPTFTKGGRGRKFGRE